MLRTLFIGIGSVVIPFVCIFGFIGIGILIAVTIDELFETFFK